MTDADFLFFIAPSTPQLFAPQQSTPQPFIQQSAPQQFGSHLTRFSNQGTATSSVTSGSDTNAEDADGDYSNEPQVNLMGNAGEEGEDLVLMTRARALVFKPAPGPGWGTQGVGALRVLVNQAEGRARLVLRAEPSGKVVLNTAIQKAINYTVSENSVQFVVARPDGSSMDMWALRVKTKEAAAELGKALNSAKSSVRA
jgi:hypothetical protein